MNHVTIRKTTLGVGIPKIFVPLISKTPEELFADAAAIARTAADIVEWRADWQESIFEEGRVLNILRSLREQLGEMPLLFTFRTFPEGGNMEATGEQYKSLTATAITSGLVDMVDIELSAGEETVKELISLAKERDVKVIMSNHDFYATPSKEEMIGRLRRMEELGTDIAKIAVMPGCPEDVLALLETTLEANKSLSCPIITMSMKGSGLISRLCGEVFGSCGTFGTAGAASAPGQIDAGELKTVLEIIHKSL